MNDNREPAGYETHIKPLFRDRQSMPAHFDLWSYGDVSQNVDAVLARLRTGTMPRADARPLAHVNLFERRIESGKPRNLLPQIQTWEDAASQYAALATTWWEGGYRPPIVLKRTNPVQVTANDTAERGNDAVQEAGRC